MESRGYALVLLSHATRSHQVHSLGAVLDGKVRTHKNFRKHIGRRISLQLTGAQCCTTLNQQALCKNPKKTCSRFAERNFSACRCICSAYGRSAFSSAGYHFIAD